MRASIPHAGPLGPARRRHALRMTLSLGALLLVASILGCGGKKRRILNPNVPRNPVLFESDGARQIFESTLESRYADGDGDLPGKTGTLSFNAYYNREFPLADVDGDGILSEQEAQSFKQR